jgi:hypothetical protein
VARNVFLRVVDVDFVIINVAYSTRSVCSSFGELIYYLIR